MAVPTRDEEIFLALQDSATRWRLFNSFTIGLGDSCWFWTGDTSGHAPGFEPYARFTITEGLRTRGHRAVWMALRGEMIPEDRELDHTCRRRNCVRPSHMDVVEHRINILRGTSPAAVNAAKIACVRGHLFDSVNTRIDTRGYRTCRSCARDRARNSITTSVLTIGESAW
jgi:hypothetical protein